MTGTNVMNRRQDEMPHDYLGGTGIVKSKTSIGISGSRHSDVRAADKRQERSAKTSTGNLNHNNTNKSGGSGSGGVPSNHVAVSRKSNRQRQRPSDMKAGGKYKIKDDNSEVKSSPVPPILPPISSLQITNNHHYPAKTSERSPRFLESSASNIAPLSLAPTRMGLRNSASPDLHGATNNHAAEKQTPEIPNDVTNSKNAPNSGVEVHGTKRNSLPVNLPNGCVRLATSSVSPPPRSPRVITDNSRLSPINSQDKPKTKFEKKVMKSIMDQSGAASPRAYRINSSEMSQGHPQSREGKTPTQRRPSVKSLPKLNPYDEHFSIRKKIEQFRKWHEEQHEDNLKRLPAEDEISGNGAYSKTVQRMEHLPSCSTDVMDFAKILEEKIVENNVVDDEVEENNEKEVNNQNGGGNDKKVANTVRGRKHRAKNRPASGATWKTWRGVNESDAYDDVKKYIKENDLMDKEREEWITSWIHDVGVAMSEMGDITIEV